MAVIERRSSAIAKEQGRFEGEVLANLKTIQSQLVELTKSQASMDARITLNAGAIQKVSDTVYGSDGRGGLVEQASSNSTNIENLKNWKAFVLGGAATVSFIVSIIVALAASKIGH